jgi:hypothetical protein
MSTKVIRCTIVRNGPTKIEAVGFEGVGCSDAVDRLTARLAATPVGEPTYKPEYATEPTGENLELDPGA